MEIKKPLNDDRQYRHIKLDNGLEAVLIHDEKTDESGASMMVNVGARDDPKEFNGLAHFLEHMLFMGTEKFPDENHFSKLVNSKGGGMNAYTSYDHTNYHFSVPTNGFTEVIECWSQFFVSPLLKKDSTDREINAVDSEHEKNIHSDSRRVYNILKEVADDDHPFSKFGTGNKETLDKDGVYDALLVFYGKYYKAGEMKLSIIDKMSLDDQEDMVRRLFSDVSGGVADKSKIESMPFSSGKIIGVTPIKDHDSLFLLWQVRENRTIYKTGAMNCILSVINSSHPGSLSHSLKDGGYVFSSSGGIYEEDDSMTLIAYSCMLTKKGYENIDAIIGCIKNFISNLSSMITREVFDQDKRISNLHFETSHNGDAESTVTDIANATHLYNLNDVLYGPYMYADYDEALPYINDILSNMKNEIILISSKKLESNKIIKEKWYEAEYHMIEKINDCNLDIDVTSIPMNNYIPTDTSLLDIESSDIPMKKDNMYIRPDIRYKKPFAYLTLIMGRDQDDIKTTIARELTVHILSKKLDPLIHQHDDIVPGSFSMNHESCFFVISVMYYTSLLHKVTTDTIDELLKVKITEDDFDNGKELVIQYLKNTMLETPHWLANEFIDMHYLHGKNILADELKFAEELTYNDILEEHKNLLKIKNITVLCEGNVDHNITETLQKILTHIHIENAESKCHKLSPITDNVSLISDAYNKKENNNAVVVSYDIGQVDMRKEDEIRRVVLLKLLQMIIDEPFYDTLRTKKQLGYVVHARISYVGTYNNHIYTHRMVIQSPTHSPMKLVAYIDKFLDKFREGMDDIDITDYKSFLHDNINKKFNDINEHVAYNVVAVVRFRKNFEVRKIMTKILKDITLNDVIEFYDKYYTNGHRIISGINKLA